MSQLESAHQAKDNTNPLTDLIQPTIETNLSINQIFSQHKMDNSLDTRVTNGVSNVDVKSLISYSQMALQRLPLLEVIFERLMKSLTTSLRIFTSSNVEVNIVNMVSMQFGDYIEQVEAPALISVVRSRQWQTLSLLSLSPQLIYTIMDRLLGGRNQTKDRGSKPLDFTPIERHLIKGLVKLILDDFSKSFTSVTPVTFVDERLEINPRFALIVRPADAVILTRLNIMLDGQAGEIEFCIPYASIEPVHEHVLQIFRDQKSSQII